MIKKRYCKKIISVILVLSIISEYFSIYINKTEAASSNSEFMKVFNEIGHYQLNGTGNGATDLKAKFNYAKNYCKAKGKTFTNNDVDWEGRGWIDSWENMAFYSVQHYDRANEKVTKKATTNGDIPCYLCGNSSSAKMAVPVSSGLQIKAAYLVLSGTVYGYSGTDNTAANLKSQYVRFLNENFKLKLPDGTVKTAAGRDFNWISPLSDTDKLSPSQLFGYFTNGRCDVSCVSDITDMMKALYSKGAGYYNGTYTAYNVPCTQSPIGTFSDSYGSWKIIIVEENPSVPIRSCTVNLGGVSDKAYNDLSITGIEALADSNVQLAKDVTGQFALGVDGGDDKEESNTFEYHCSNMSWDDVYISGLRKRKLPFVRGFTKDNTEINGLSKSFTFYADFDTCSPGVYRRGSDFILDTISNKSGNIGENLSEKTDFSFRIKSSGVQTLFSIVAICADVAMPDMSGTASGFSSYGQFNYNSESGMLGKHDVTFTSPKLGYGDENKRSGLAEVEIKAELPSCLKAPQYIYFIKGEDLRNDIESLRSHIKSKGAVLYNMSGTLVSSRYKVTNELDNGKAIAVVLNGNSLGSGISKISLKGNILSFTLNGSRLASNKENGYTLSASVVAPYTTTSSSNMSADFILNGNYLCYGIDTGIKIENAVKSNTVTKVLQRTAIIYNSNNTKSEKKEDNYYEFTDHAYRSAVRQLIDNPFTNGSSVFKGWTEDLGGTGTAYAPGSYYNTGTYVTNMYAQWEKCYNLVVDYNGGSPSSITNDNPNAMFINEGKKYSGIAPDKELTVTTPERTGYTFAGWSITGYDSNYSEQLWSSQKNPNWNKISSVLSNGKIGPDCYKNAGSNRLALKALNRSGGTVTMKAEWSYNGYSLSVDYNGGRASQTANDNPNAMLINEEKTYSGIASDKELTVTTPVRTGHAFAGWSIAGYDDSSLEQLWSSRKNPSWNKISAVLKEGIIGKDCYKSTGSNSLALKALNGSGGTVTMKAEWKLGNYLVKCIDVLVKQTGNEEHEYWSGYYTYGSVVKGSDFNEGDMNEYYDNYNYSSCSEITVSDDTGKNIVYRYFVPRNQCEVVFNAASNGGTYTDKEKTKVENNIYKTTAVYGGEMPSIGAAQKDGYKFTGWWTDKNGGMKVYDENGMPASSWYTGYSSDNPKWNCDYNDTDTFYAQFEEYKTEIGLYAESGLNPDRYYDPDIDEYNGLKSADGYWYKDEVTVTAEGKCNYDDVAYMYQYIKGDYDIETSRGDYYENIFIRTYKPSYLEINSQISYDKFVTVYGKTLTSGGDYAEKEAVFFVDSQAPNLTLAKNISMSGTDWIITSYINDGQSGLKKLELQKKQPGTDWEAEECINYTHDEAHRNLTEKLSRPLTGDMAALYRIALYDNVGHVSYSEEFTTGKPLELNASLRKLNGETAGSGETLIFYEWGDMTCWIDCETFGHADKLTVEMPPELSLTTQQAVSLDASLDESSHTFEFLLNEGTMEYGREYEVTVTAYRGTEKVEKKLNIQFLEHQKVYRYIEYVNLQSITIDWSNFFLFSWCKKLNDWGDELGFGN